MEVRARVVIQEKGLYTISYNGNENIAEVSGKFRYDAKEPSDFPTVGEHWFHTEEQRMFELKQRKRLEKHKGH